MPSHHSFPRFLKYSINFAWSHIQQTYKFVKENSMSINVTYQCPAPQEPSKSLKFFPEIVFYAEWFTASDLGRPTSGNGRGTADAVAPGDGPATTCMMLQQVLSEGAWKDRLTGEDRQGMTPLFYGHLAALEVAHEVAERLHCIHRHGVIERSPHPTDRAMSTQSRKSCVRRRL